jgi:hypothetical protein
LELFNSFMFWTAMVIGGVAGGLVTWRLKIQVPLVRPAVVLMIMGIAISAQQAIADRVSARRGQGRPVSVEMASGSVEGQVIKFLEAGLIIVNSSSGRWTLLPKSEIKRIVDLPRPPAVPQPEPSKPAPARTMMKRYLSLGLGADASVLLPGHQ